MRKAIQIDEAEYKIAAKKGAEVLINKDKRPHISNAEVNAIDGEYWLSYDVDEIKAKATQARHGADYLNGWSHTII